MTPREELEAILAEIAAVNRKIERIELHVALMLSIILAVILAAVIVVLIAVARTA